MAMPKYRTVVWRAMCQSGRLVIASSWRAWGVKIASTGGLLIALYLYTVWSEARDEALFGDAVTVFVLAMVVATALVMAVFFAQLLFVAPFQLWKREWERAETAEAALIPPAKPPRPLRDATLNEGLIYACFGQWGGDPTGTLFFGDPDIERFGDCRSEFEKAAKDGELTVWGKEASPGFFMDSLWDLIEPAFWKESRVKWGSVILGDDAETEHRHQPGVGHQYRQLMISKAQFVERWPHDEG